MNPERRRSPRHTIDGQSARLQVSLPVRVMQLKADAKYRAQAFDPTNGKLNDLGAVELGAPSGGIIKKPASIQSDDWVVVIQRID